MREDVERHILKPLVVSSVLLPDPSGAAEHVPVALLVSVNPDDVPGFREILNRQEAGEEFDVNTRWGAGMDEEGEHSPTVLVDFYLPEFELAIVIPIDVDEYPNSIQAGIRTGRVAIVDPDRYLRLLEAPEMGTAMDELRVFTVQPGDPTPAIGVLQQRFNYPRPSYQPEMQTLTPEVSAAVGEKFIEGGRMASAAAFVLRGDGPTTIFLVDPESGPIKEAVSDEAKVEGRWGAISGKEHDVLAFDAFADGRHLGRWLMLDPDIDLVRAGTHGSHSVAIVKEPLSKDQEEANRQWREALHVWVANVETLRTLLLAKEL